MIHNALPIRNWWHDFFGFKILPQFLAHKNMLQCRENLKAKITQLLPNRISGPLILNGRLNLTVLAQRNQAVNCESGMRFLSFSCDLCDAVYVGYIARHLHQPGNHACFILVILNCILSYAHVYWVLFNSICYNFPQLDCYLQTFFFDLTFIDQITLHINERNNSSYNQHIPMKAAFVLLALAL